MIPSRKIPPSSDETNLQNPIINPVVNSNPLPPRVIEDGGNPPPVPRRQPGSMYQPSYPSSLYGGYGMNPYGMNQNLGFLSGFNNPMVTAGVGASLPGNSTFETVGQSAFQSVSSVVQTLGSVSMMLQSTLFAVQNSVQAITNVGHQFVHLRGYLIEMCISTIRIIKYYYRKLLYLFGLGRKAGVDVIWDEATHAANGTSSSPDRRGILLFFAVVVGTPYMLWSLLKHAISQSESANSWQKGIGEHFSAEVKFTYKAVNNDELSITCGDILQVAPKHLQPPIKGWILASKDAKRGLIPVNYIKILGKSENSDTSLNSKIQELKEEEDENVPG